MRCAKCTEAKAVHTVSEEDRSSLFTGWPSRMWDASDREHRHDPRVDLVYLRCSNGHAFKAIERIGAACPAIERSGCEYDKGLAQSVAKTLTERFGKDASDIATV